MSDNQVSAWSETLIWGWPRKIFTNLLPSLLCQVLLHENSFVSLEFNQLDTLKKSLRTFVKSLS